MLEVISRFIVGFVTHLIDSYIFTKIEKNIEFKLDKKTVLVLIIFSMVDCFMERYYGMWIRTIISNINTVILLTILYRKSIVKTVIFSVMTLLVYALGELMVSLTVISVMKINPAALEQMSLNYILNIVIFILYYSVCSAKWFRKLVSFIMGWMKDNEILNSIVIGVVTYLCVTSLIYPLTFSDLADEETFFFVLFLLGTMILVSGFFKQKSDNNKLQTDYDLTNEYLQAYEKALGKKNREEHEHMNQLVIIRDMAHKSNHRLINYVNGLIGEKEEANNSDYLKKLKNIPEGGLKGFIHCKIEKMQENKIEVYVNISEKLSKKSIWKEMDNSLKDVSMSLGVYLDNAMEAARESKKKYVVIEANYEKGNVIFEISNTYKEIREDAKTTKGVGRGQGLLLVRDIIDKNKRLNSEKEICGGYYVQRLIYSLNK